MSLAAIQRFSLVAHLSRFTSGKDSANEGPSQAHAICSSLLWAAMRSSFVPGCCAGGPARRSYEPVSRGGSDPGRDTQRDDGDNHRAPPARVWPWLVQMGFGRAGWYSWDHLDNWGRASAERIHPEWQEIAVGDHLPGMPDDKAWWEVAALEPEHFLGLRASYDLKFQPFDPNGPRPRFYTDSLWGFRWRSCQVVGLASWSAAIGPFGRDGSSRWRASCSWKRSTGSCRRVSSRGSSGWLKRIPRHGGQLELRLQAV